MALITKNRRVDVSQRSLPLWEREEMENLRIEKYGGASGEAGDAYLMTCPKNRSIN